MGRRAEPSEINLLGKIKEEAEDKKIDDHKRNRRRYDNEAARGCNPGKKTHFCELLAAVGGNPFVLGKR